MSSNSPINRAMTPLEWGMLLCLSVLWGGSFFFNAVAVKELPTFTIVVCRVVFASVLLLGVLQFTGASLPRTPQIWTAFFQMGLLNNVVPFILIVWGQAHIASGVASILIATTPLFTVVVAHWWTRDEPMTGPRLAGVIVGLVGVAIMVGGDALRSMATNITAQLACLAAAVSYAIATVFGRRFRAMNVAPLVTATGQVIASSVMLTPAMLLVDRPWTLPVPGTATIGAIIGVAALSTASGYILYFRILSSAGATNIALVTFLIPVSAILLGVLCLGEALLVKHFFGMAMIGLGLVAIDGRAWRRARSFFFSLPTTTSNLGRKTET
jgi:drug/metabolite transporter (DMT)-like permease